MFAVCAWKQGPSNGAGVQSGSLSPCVGFVTDLIATG